MNPVYVVIAALKKHAGNIDLATAETGLLRSFVADIARKFKQYMAQ